MGSAASSSKNAVIPFSHSRSDTCQCHSYEERVKDLEKKLKELQDNRDNMMQEISKLNEILTELEGEKMDQADTIQSLETRLESYMDEGAGDQYVETVKAKDQIITNLEKEITDNEAEFTKQRVRWRRKLRHHATQLAEAKHSSAIRVMEMRQEMARLMEESEQLKKKTREQRTKDNHSGSDSDSAAGNNGLVVELSQQMLEQTMKIKKLEHSLQERERQLSDLQEALAARSGSGQRAVARRGERGVKAGARQWSGYSHDSGLDSDAAPDSAGLAGRRSHVMSATAASLSPLSERDGSQTAAAADEALYRDITEDRNWDAVSLASSDTVGPSPWVHLSGTRPTSARRDSSSRPNFDRGRSIILDPDKEYTIDSVLQLATNT